MPSPRRKGLSPTQIIVIVVAIALLGVGGYFLQRALMAKPGTFGYAIPNYLYIPK